MTVFPGFSHCPVQNRFSRTRRFSHKSTLLAELDASCRTRRFLQNSTVLAELDQYRSQNLTVLAELDQIAARTLRLSQNSTGFAISSPFCPLWRLIIPFARKSVHEYYQCRGDYWNSVHVLFCLMFCSAVPFIFISFDGTLESIFLVVFFLSNFYGICVFLMQVA